MEPVAWGRACQPTGGPDLGPWGLDPGNRHNVGAVVGEDVPRDVDIGDGRRMVVELDARSRIAGDVIVFDIDSAVGTVCGFDIDRRFVDCLLRHVDDDVVDERDVRIVV